MEPSMSNGENRSATLTHSHQPWFIIAVLIWTVIIAGLLAWEISSEHEQSIALVSNEARAYLNKDKAFRLWAASHGGVYVPVDERTLPNPHLSHIPERDIITPSGKKLTLMNPAYMLRQLMNDYSQLYGVKGKITSFPDKLLNPENMPDEWELAALKSFKQGASEAKDIINIDGIPHFRLMRPLFIDQGCLKCHGFQGYKFGELRGGVGVSVSMAPYLEAEQKTISGLYMAWGTLWAVGLLAFVIFSQFKAHKRAEENQVLLNRELERLSSMDGLTGIANRRTFDAVLEREWKRAQRSRKPLSLIMIDIDFFKQFNDCYGHQQGDECLRQVARVLAATLRRAADLAARYGGEEFALLLPETDLEQAVWLAKECRSRIIEQQIAFKHSTISNVVTISLGVGTSVPVPGISPSALIEIADKALYRAKENGRNRVESG
jgi:diguanylate cyclase (GGDEF)-like protein